MRRWHDHEICDVCLFDLKPCCVDCLPESERSMEGVRAIPLFSDELGKWEGVPSCYVCGKRYPELCKGGV